MLSGKNKEQIKFVWDSFINSYSQMFFSDNRIFAYLILLSSFINPYAGISGVIAVLVSVLIAQWLGFNRTFTLAGTYSSNSLMVGLVMGLYFNFSPQFFIILLVMSLLTTVLSKAIAIVFSKYQLPIFAFPFLLAVWALLLALRSSPAIALNDSGLFVHNELYSLGGIHLVQMYEKLDNLNIPEVLEAYLKSLGAIYFQYNIISGLFIAIGLLVYSRIAFTLSIVGFLTGYYFFQFLNGTAAPLNYNFIGFNYILAAICIGGFFFIPSKKSYLLALLTAPVLAIMHSSMMAVFDFWHLPIYSLPFNVIMIVLLLTLRNRVESNGLEMVWLQQFSPEKNLYKHLTQSERFSKVTYFHIHLPFFGDWYVSQGHDGKITHLGDWKYAWDFVVTNEMKNTFRLPGNSLTDYYCYNAPILSPGAGYVYQIVDEVEENAVGDVDIAQNWGNTIIIKHTEYLYSKISHIKKGSFKVNIGDYVRKGDVIASCGNSGRSPEPHIHFQLQSTPFVGSKTLKYPISYYVEKKIDGYKFRAFDYPEERATISGIRTTQLLKTAFKLIPGEVLKFEVSGLNTKEPGKKEIVKWEVFTDAYNSTYIYCHNSKSYAYFVNNDTLHYFTEFYGDKNSLLYYFFLGGHKVLLGYYDQMEINDLLPMSGLYSGFSKFIQDFIAPFYVYLKARYTSTFKFIDDENNPKKIIINSSATVKAATRVLKELNFEMHLENNRLQTFKLLRNNKPVVAECIS